MSASVLSPFYCPLARRLPTLRRIVESQFRAIIHRLFATINRAAAIRHEILPEHHEGSRGDDARERFRDRHLAHIGIDGAIEAHVFGERIDEHQRVVDVSTNDRFFGARSGETQTAFSRRFELAAEDALWEQPAKESEHGCNLRG